MQISWQLTRAHTTNSRRRTPDGCRLFAHTLDNRERHCFVAVARSGRNVGKASFISFNAAALLDDLIFYAFRAAMEAEEVYFITFCDGDFCDDALGARPEESSGEFDHYPGECGYADGERKRPPLSADLQRRSGSL